MDAVQRWCGLRRLLRLLGGVLGRLLGRAGIRIQQRSGFLASASTDGGRLRRAAFGGAASGQGRQAETQTDAEARA